MGLPWIRLDVGLPRNPKMVLLLSEREGRAAAFVYVCGLAYCGEQGSDGFIPRGALPLVHGRPKDAELLVKYELWHNQRGGSGWRVHGWEEYQQSSIETQERAERARRASLKANCKRWHEPGCTCWTASD